MVLYALLYALHVLFYALLRAGDDASYLLGMPLGMRSPALVRHRPGERVPDCPLRRSGAGAREPFHRTDAHGSTILAGCRCDDADSDPHCGTRHQQWTVGVVPRGAGVDGLSHLRDDPLPAAAPSAAELNNTP